jgi:hypothetical protein
VVVARIFNCLALFSVSIYALEIQRDLPDVFVFTDDVKNVNEQSCKNEFLFMPENSAFFGKEDAPGIPFRTYVIALPNSTPPSVELENLKSEQLKGKPCGAEQNFRALKVGEPYLRDNLWRVKINVPLIYSNGSAWNVRRSFRLKINFNGGANGFSVGKRALASVENKAGANKFGTKQIASSRTMLKKPDAGIDWLLRIGIGVSDLSLNADGMYAVSFEDLQKAMRASGREREMDGIPVSSLRLFSASPDTLPEYIDEEIFPNTQEIPIEVKDNNNDATFNGGDSLVFFGHGTALWKQSGSESGMDYYFSHSPYSFYQYFYLGAGGVGERIKTVKNENTGRDIAWKKYARTEKDLILRDNYFGDDVVEENTGKEWFWAWGVKNSTVTVDTSEFQNTVKNLNAMLENSDSIWIGVSFFPRRSIYSYDEKLSDKPWKERMRGIDFNFYFQNELQKNIIDTIFGGTFVFASYKARASDNRYKVEILSKERNDRFDGISVAYKHNPLSSLGDEWLFPGKAFGSVKIPVPANMEIIKVKDFIPVEIIAAENPLANSHANDAIPANSDVKYFLHKKNSYKIPASIEAIPVSDVSNPLDIPVQTEYVILTSETLQEPAKKLKKFREEGSAPITLNTAIVLIEDIFRYHGGHSSPVAIRDFLRYAKNRCPNLRFVLLAGNGNYDYRKIRRSVKINIIPPYEAEDMATDDFFVILDKGEAVRFGTYDLDLAIGRLPVSNVSEFENYVQKAIDYEKVSAMDNGVWRNTIVLTADDDMQGTAEDWLPHTRQMETTAEMVNSISRAQNFATEMRKISLLQYEKDGTGKKPEASKELLLRLNQGALFTYYYGHGNAVQWADENLMSINSLSAISNTGRYTILGSFSCLVARFDDVALTSLSEAFVDAKSKGAIAAIGSLRESLSNYNVLISQNFLSHSLSVPGISIGEALLRAKLDSGLSYSRFRYNNEKYVLLGEPVLSMPKWDKISLNLENAPDTIQALQRIRISGETSAQAGSVHIQILEGEKQRMLFHLGNPAPIKTQGAPIYNEELKITGGKFSTEFVTPRKLSLGDTNAQIRLWAYEPGKDIVGKKVIDKISLFGTSADTIKDNAPPSIKIYPCMRSGIAAPFEENARISLEIPACLNIVIEDSTGLDYREEADEGISFEVSGSAAWHPWPFSVQTGRRAEARMNFGDSYEPGEYVFRVNAQDILGNAAMRSIRISLSQENKEGLADIFNMPNPMKNSTTFYFKDLSGDRQSSVSIKIFNQNGKLVKTINNVISGTTSWDGRDSRGRLLANGLYHYVVQNTVSSIDGSGGKRIFEKKQKLVISR